MPSLSAPSYRDRQWAERFDGPTEDVNVFIDGLNRRHLSHGMVPYIAPIHGGLNARVLGLLSSPPDNVTGAGGTKMLSVENDDDAARFVAEQLKSSGIAYADYLPWNAYPWPLGNGRADLTPDQVHLGADILAELMAHMPHLKVVIELGKGAPMQVHIRARRTHPELRARGITRIETYSPGPGGLFGARSEQQRQERNDERARAFRQAARILRK